MSRIEDIRHMLEKADQDYYDSDSSTMSDAEYDALCSEYKSLTGQDWNFDKVPGNVSQVFGEVHHQFPAKSLDKINMEQELRAELKRLAPGIIQKKWDGLTLVIYPDGTVSTRGNGEIGENVTHTVGLITKGKSNNGMPIRGEAILRKSDFDAINNIRVNRGEEPYKNRRNAVAGLIRTKEPDLELLRYVHFIAYNILGSTMSESEQLSILNSCGYETDYSSMWKFTKADENTVNYVTNFDRSTVDFEIDGLVIKNDEPNANERFGMTAHHYRSAVAYKFPSQGVWTKLLGVRWSVGRTGKVVPNADIAPITLLNATVTKASIHNASMLDRKGLCQGCEVYVVKANDVIPDIRDVRGGNPDKPFSIPDECPVCHSKLRVQDSKDNEGVYQLYCDNVECPSKTVLRVVNMAQRDALDIDGLSIETAQKMYDDCLIDKPEDIFKLTVDDIMELEGFAKPSAAKLYKAIQARRKVSLAKFIYSAGVPTIGKSKAEDLANYFQTYEAFIKDISLGCPQVRSSITGFGKELIANIIKYHQWWKDLKQYIEPESNKKIKKASVQLTFVITGTLPQPRKYYEDLIKSMSHKVSSSVSGKTDYLVAGEDCGSKLDDAKAKGTKIISDVVPDATCSLSKLEEIIQ